MQETPSTKKSKWVGVHTPIGIPNLNLGFTKAQQVVRHVAMARQWANEHVLACLHPPSS
jgi:hypothetical protein